ncbi:hypothetical protein F4778DRAFT_784552 [Xylariomycetidae sp. FL2044]|nr:hypothetical protein F4778DRAFT_784552 [Xylariomycetidae sp. FL2044]
MSTSIRGLGPLVGTPKTVSKEEYRQDELYRLNIWRGGKIRGGAYNPSNPYDNALVANLDDDSEDDQSWIQIQPGQRKWPSVRGWRNREVSELRKVKCWRITSRGGAGGGTSEVSDLDFLDIQQALHEGFHEILHEGEVEERRAGRIQGKAMFSEGQATIIDGDRLGYGLNGSFVNKL